ncbi:MAG: cupin domain-containing protein [Azovibrio sp.]
MQQRPPLSNLFDTLPASATEAEEFVTLLKTPGLTIERIVSTGHSSPPDFWYDQSEDEWVLVLQGEAQLDFEGETQSRHVGPGDFLHIPAHQRHRVAWTTPEQATIWLAIHHSPPCPKS